METKENTLAHPPFAGALILIGLLATGTVACAAAPTDTGPRADAAVSPMTDGSAPATGDAAAQGSANAIACQHLRAGPYQPVTAKATDPTYADLGPPIQNSRAAYRLTLPAPPKLGSVSFKVPASGEYVIFTSRLVPITVFTWDGAMVVPKSVASTVSECPEVKGRESFDLTVDTKAHVIKFSGDPAMPLDVVLSAAAP